MSTRYGGAVSREAVYAFTILPPWYRTWLAYGGYIALLALAVFVVDRLQPRLSRERVRRAHSVNYLVERRA